MKIYSTDRAFIIVFILLTHLMFSQGNFELKNGIQKQRLSFKLLNNLVVFPIEVNGKELNFILDSGVGSTILFNINNTITDSLPLHNVEKIKLRGLGSEDAIDAILSKGNSFDFGNVRSTNQSLYVVFDDSFDLSSKLGITIHGIIGYQLLKDFVIEVNYSTKKITFYNPLTYKEKQCKNCETFPLEFNTLKPYVTVGIKMNENQQNPTPVKLLIDSGGSDALWLFEGSHASIKTPTKYFDAFLGEGLSGVIYGKKSFIPSLHIGKFSFKKPTVSFPDSISIINARKFEERNGSIGAGILKRFTVTYNYPSSLITFKKGGNYNEPFRYNMSGIELAYNGKLLVKEHDYTKFSLAKENDISDNNSIFLEYNYKYTFKPSYKIFKIRKGSPADLAGLQADDIVIKINGKFTHNYKIEEITEKFYQKENKKIELLIERYGQNYLYTFKLKDMLK